MKKILILLICFLPSTCIAQYPHEIRPAIYFINLKTLHVTRIKQGTHIGYILANDKQYKDVVIDRVSHDSIFFGNTWFTIKDVILLTNPVTVWTENLHDPISYHGMGIIFRNDTAGWKYLCPSQDAYSINARLSEEIKAFRTDAKNEKRQKNYKPIQNNYLQLNLTRLLNFDFAVSYERKFSGSISLSTELGYKVATGQGPSLFDAFFAFAQSGPSLIIGPKFYFKKKFYFSPLLHLKYLEIHGSSFKEPFSDQYPTLMDQFETLSGVSLRLGIMAHTGSCWFDFYLGAGVKYTSAYQVMYCYYHDDETFYFSAKREPKIQNVFNWYPIVNLGIKIGIGF